MKRFAVTILPLMVLFFMTSGFKNVSGEEAVVKIDGNKIQEGTDVVLERDDTVWLEATGIKPNSKIDIKVKKLGIAWMKDFYEVDKTGEVKGVMHIPEEKLTVNCFVEYYAKDGSFHEVKFKFKTR